MKSRWRVQSLISWVAAELQQIPIKTRFNIYGDLPSHEGRGEDGEGLDGGRGGGELLPYQPPTLTGGPAAPGGQLISIGNSTVRLGTWIILIVNTKTSTSWI